MAGKNKAPLIGWHPPPELSAWARRQAERRGVTLSMVLTEALEAYRATNANRARPAWDVFRDEKTLT